MLAGFETRMSSTFSTSPTPKKLAQRRLAIERAKVRVIRRGEPFGQAYATVGRIVKGQRLAIERGGRLRLAGPRLHQLARLGNVERPPAVARHAPRPPSPWPAPGQTGSPSRNTDRWSIFRAGGCGTWRSRSISPRNAWRDVFRHVFGRLAERVEVGGAVFDAFARCRDDRPHELVPGRTGGYLLVNPLVVALERHRAQPRAAEHQQVRPFVGPVVGELRPFEQALDEGISLGWCGCRRGRPWPRRSRAAGRSYRRRRGAANSASVQAGEAGRLSRASCLSICSSMKLRGLRLIDDLSWRRWLALIGHGDPGDRQAAGIPGHHSSFAGPNDLTSCPARRHGKPPRR